MTGVLLALVLAPLTFAFPAAAAPRRHAVSRHVRLARRTSCKQRHSHSCKTTVKAKRKAAPKKRSVAPAPAAPVSTTTTISPAPQSTPAPAAAPVPPCTNTQDTPTPQNIAQMDTTTICLINGVRLAHGLAALTPNSALEAAAVPYTQSMIDNDFFAHVTPSGSTPVQRITAAGYIPSNYTYYMVGENIAWGTLDLATPAAIVNAWINSPEHLANILNPQFRDTAIAVVAAAPPSLASGQSGATFDQEFGVVQTG